MLNAKVCLITGVLFIITNLAWACRPQAPEPTPAPAPVPAPQPTVTGTVEIRATDAPPSGVSSITVTAANIEIHQADAPEDTWVTVVAEEKSFDLVAIQSAEVFLGEKEVTSGNYTQIRLDVSKVLITLEGKEIEAKLPSGKLKVVRPWEVKPDEKTILTLDFDADEFVVITGQDSAQVKPVIKLAVSQGERPLTSPEPSPPAPAIQTASRTPHPNRQNCLRCHGPDKSRSYPADHAGRSEDETCFTCHKP